MVVTVVGLGFVGLTTAVAFAQKGMTVYGIEQDAEKRALIGAGTLPFLEPGLDDALVQVLGRTFSVDTALAEAVAASDCVMLCVGTPSQPDGSVDLGPLLQAVDEALPHMGTDRPAVLVVKSTVPPGTTAEVVAPRVRQEAAERGVQIGVADNPEFLREGFAWEDVLYPDRIVVGAQDDATVEVMKRLYAGFDSPFIAVDLSTAEFVKYLSNTLLATLISWSNEMSMVANAVGDIAIGKAFRILHMDKRWGEPACGMASYAYPGCGYGGYCLPKDTKALYAHACSRGYEPRMLRDAITVNETISKELAQRIARQCPEGVRIGVCGLSFKPGSSDVRDSPAAQVIGSLVDLGCGPICAYDPVAADEFARAYDLPISYADSLDDLVEASDALVIATAWSEFSELPTLADGKPIFDLRYML